MVNFPIATAFSLSGLFSTLIALYAWYRRNSPGSVELTWLMGAAALWSFTSALEWVGADLGTKLFWSVVSYVGSQSTPVLFFIFVMRYTQQDARLNRKAILLLFIFPTASLVMAATNQWHHLLWPEIILRETPAGVRATYIHGTWFWLQIVYAYGLLSLGIAALLRSLVRFPHLYTPQSRLILLGSLAPLLCNAVYAANPQILDGADPTPIAFTLTGLLLGWNIFRFQFLDVSLIAREKLIEDLCDGVVLLDMHQRVLDMNLTAQEMLGIQAQSTQTSFIGSPASRVIAQWQEIRPICQSQAASPLELLVGGDPPRTLEITRTAVKNHRGRPIGCSILLHDITARKQIEQALQESENRYRLLVENQSEGIVIVAAGGNFTFANPAAEKILGISPGQLVGCNLSDIATPEAFTLIQEHTPTHISGQKNTFEFTIISPTEGKRVIEVTATPQYSSTGRYTSAFGILRDVTERKQAQQALESRERFLTNMNEVTSAALEASDLTALLQTLADRMGSLIHADGCDITLWDEKNQRTIPMAASGSLRETYRTKVVSKPTDQTMTKSVLAAGHALVAEDVFNSPYISPNVAAPFPTRSMLGLPLIAGDRKLGAALVAYNSPHAFTAEEVALGEQAAAQISLAVAKTTLLEELRLSHENEIQHTQNLTKLAAQLYTAAEVARSATSFLELDKLLRHVVNLAAERFGLYYMGLFLVDGSGEWAVLQAATGPAGQKMVADGFRLAIGGQSMVGWCIANRQARLAQEADQDLMRLANPLLPDAQSEMTLPMISRDQAIGALTIQRSQANTFSDSDLAVFQTMADQLANAITNARLYEQIQKELAERKLVEIALQRRAQEMSALYDTSLDINSELDLPTLLRAIVERAIALSGAQMGGLYLLRPNTNTLELVVSHQLPKNYTGTIIQLGEGLSGRVALTGEVMMIPDYTHWEGRAAAYEGIGVQRVLGVPLKSRGQVIGVINITDAMVSGNYSEEQVRLVSLFADQAAIAVENARLLEDLQRANVLLEKLATTDKLTGVYNRRKFDDVFIYEVRKARRYHLPLVLLMFDIDHFKQVNDTFGHHAGDQTLVELVKLVRENIRGSDWLARWGGEEFMILAPGISLEQAMFLAEKIRKLVATHPFGSVDHITISIGVTPYLPGDTPAAMEKRVDEALYIAKNGGRDRFAVLPNTPARDTVAHGETGQLPDNIQNR